MSSPITRRQFVAGTAGLGLVAGCGRLPWQGQPRAKVPRIGFLWHAAPEPMPEVEAFRGGLRGLGYVEGQNLVVEYRYADEEGEQFPALAAELVQLPVDVLVVGSTPGIKAAQQVTGTIPLVMPTSGADPVAQGLVASLAHPGGNLTGLSAMDPQLSGKRLELLTQAVSGAKRVAVLMPSNPNDPLRWAETQAAASALSIALQALEVRSPDELAGAFEAAARERAEALLVVRSPLTHAQLPRIAELAARGRLPAMYEGRDFVAVGGLMAYGPNQPAMFRRAAAYVDKILKGAKPADLPIEQPMTFDFLVNLKTARELGITFPNEIMLQVTEVIE